jgi:MoaA/NifB/PqqE/SkfB family radical SAM enzyme
MTLSESRVQFDRRDYRMEALPEGIAIEPVMGCNLRCPMCAVPDAPHSTNGRKPTLMPLDLYQRIIEQISDRRRGVMLTIMGEPLLHPQLADFVAIAKKAGHHVAIITNGTRLTRERSTALLDAGLDYLAMSMDGLTKATYEGLRIGSTHETVLQNFLDLIEVNTARGTPLRVELNYVVTSGTAHEQEAYYRRFSPHVRKINFIPLCDWGGQLQLGEELGPVAAPPGRQRLACFGLWGSMYISAEGRAMMCCADFRYAARLPSITERPLLDIWRGAVQEHRRKHIDDDFESEPCRSCRNNVVDIRIPRHTRLGMLRRQRLQDLWRAALPERLLPEWEKARRRRHDVPFGHIDIPEPAAEIAGVVNVCGWALPYRDHCIERVEVRVDGVTRGLAEWGFPRADVGEMHPGVGNSFCALGFVLDTRTLANGPHSLDIVAFDNASHSAVLGARSVTVVNQ